MVDNSRDILAACFLAQEADYFEPATESGLVWARKYIANERDTEHIHNMAATCCRCCVDQAFSHADLALAALTAAGLAVVPVEPTEEMISAGSFHCYLWNATEGGVTSTPLTCWAAMITAAPKPEHR